ncbi:hypothetical protein ABT297_12905 [Dactylosporangium sp. NPDC000555]|uniref:hypothetical protein n=1 Tax=Dactylosporangium sp. NPDC000555 TaxID=3154260 RepID=UPI00332E7A5B
MHHDLLSLLDAHLAELTALRHVLSAPRPVHPGERWAAAERTVHSAEHYAEAASTLLRPAPV